RRGTGARRLGDRVRGLVRAGLPHRRRPPRRRRSPHPSPADTPDPPHPGGTPMARTIAVSGSASGIGASLAGMLRDAGDTVIGIDRPDAHVRADLSVPEGRAGAVAQTLERAGGRLDAVVACAGVSDFTIMPVKVNFFGVVGLLEGLRPALARAEAPRAAVVGSISGTHPVDDDVVRACLAGDEPAALA